MKSARTRQFLGAGGTRRGKGARTVARASEQASLFDPDPGDVDDEPAMFEVGELARDIHRMTLETSSNVYAQRRSVW